MKLKIFSDRSYLLKADGIRPNPMLYPFWSDLAETGESPWMKRYENYLKIGHGLFEMVSLEEADFVVMPDDWKTVVGENWYSKTNKQAKKLYLEFAEIASRAGKPLIVFFGSDRSDEKFPVKSANVFRHSYYRHKEQDKNFIWPVFCEDLVENYLDNKLKIRKKVEKPVIGFCGLIKQETWETNLKKSLYQGYALINQGQFSYPPIQGHILRSRIIRDLEKNSLVDRNFVIRDSMVFLGSRESGQMHKTRLEFIQNLVESDYILCCRGAGNYSNRLFESLCCGRIPILVDTDCSLPYDFMVDWKKYCVWIKETEISTIAEKVLEFHNHLSPQEFVDLQYQCRNFWKEWLSAEGFFSKFHLHFTNKE